MNNRGWSINSFLCLLGILTFCLIVVTVLSNQLYKSVQKNEIIEDDNVSTYEIVPNDITTSNSIKNYINLEDKLKECAKSYVVNKAISGCKLIITFEKLKSENYITKLTNPHDDNSECNGYVIYNSETNEYIPYLSCGISYKTSNYNKYFE